MSIPCNKTFMLVPSSRSSVKVKVKYQGHSFRKNGRCAALGFHKHILFFLCSGKRVRNASQEEEEKYLDILLVMELLTNLLSKDFIDFGGM